MKQSRKKIRINVERLSKLLGVPVIPTIAVKQVGFDEVVNAIEKLDHYHLNDIPPFNEIQPTAENLAKFFYDELKSKLAQYKNVEIDSVEIWETEKYSAIYQEWITVKNESKQARKHTYCKRNFL